MSSLSAVAEREARFDAVTGVGTAWREAGWL
jgi:hypothetical protein